MVSRVSVNNRRVALGYTVATSSSARSPRSATSAVPNPVQT